ncbi:hypothetical protein K7432_011761 [Basidiobolus ranarum]|uniref:Carrier domain-containing protein n=1 Tax=Basidiobolus ranarum TaxID=34480 RepID=A0ABR2WLW7_9FUNG
MPKGVMMEHRSVSSFVQAFYSLWGITSMDSVLQFAKYTFDASVIEIFCTLASGACVALASKENLLSDLEKCINIMNVTALMLTPSVATLIDPLEVPSVKRVALGGEMMTTTVQDLWSPYVQLCNAYGPTEAAVAILANCNVTENTMCNNIGKPIDGNNILIVGSNLQPVPLGVVGELCVSGPQLARGYLNRPDLTEMAFVTSDFDTANRIYRTGDLALFNEDGTVRIVGRMDNQIKLNGLRIELDEIEHALHYHSQVSRACVLALATDQTVNRKSLVAFLTFCDVESRVAEPELLSGSQVTSVSGYMEELKVLVGKRLPPYMIPNIWLPLNTLPINSSDKIDRRKLSDLFSSSSLEDIMRISTNGKEGSNKVATSSGEFIETDKYDIIQPQNLTQLLIQEVWSKVLNIPQSSISIDHSFRSLGGDSILAIRVSSECRKHSIQIAVQSILKNHTICQLAQNARGAMVGRFTVDKLVQCEVHLTANQHMFMEFEQENINHFNQSWLFKMQYPTNLTLLKSAVLQLIINHDILRTRFERSGNLWKAQVIAPAELPFEVYHTQVKSRTELKDSIYELQSSLDLMSKPLFQFALYDLSDGQQLIFMAVHHLIIDLSSWGSIWEDLGLLLQGNTPDRKSISYMQWNQLLYDYAQTLDMSSWPTQPATQPIITDIGLLTNNTTENARSMSFKLDPYFTKLAERYCGPSANVEIIDLLVASLAYSYCCTFVRDALSVTLESHGRQFGDDKVDISKTVGCFTNLYPIVIEVGKSQRLEDAIRQTISQQRHIRGNEMNYGLLKYMNGKTAPHFEKGPPELTLGYMPNIVSHDIASSYLLPIPSDSEYKFDLGGVPPKWRRHQVIDCLAQHVGDQLEVRITYSDIMYSESQIQSWLDLWEVELINGIKTISKEALQTLDSSPLYMAPSGSVAHSPQFKYRCVGDIIKENDDDCLTLISEGGGPTMFIVHCATGVASYFELLGKYMHCTLYSISDPTLGTDESFDSIEMIATRYLRAILNAQPEGPYCLHGYSFGGLVVFEIARQLECQGQKVSRLTIIDTIAPHTRRRLQEHSNQHSALEYLTMISVSGGWKLEEAASQMILQKIHENVQLMRKYQPPIKKLDASIVLLKGSDAKDELEELDRQQTCYGWSEYSSIVVVRSIEAKHHELMFEPYVTKIADYLQVEPVTAL